MPKTWTARFCNCYCITKLSGMQQSWQDKTLQRALFICKWAVMHFQWLLCSLRRFASRLLPRSSQLHSHIYLITPEEHKPCAICVIATSYPVLLDASLMTSCLSIIQNSLNKNHFEQRPIVRGQYIFFLPVPTALHVHSGGSRLDEVPLPPGH